MNDHLDNEGFSGAGEEEVFEQRSIPGGAILAIVFGLLSLLSFVLGQLVLSMLGFVSAVIAVVMAFKAIMQIRRYPEEYTGIQHAMVGCVLGIFSMVGGGAYHVYDYSTEVPEGFQRISFADLQPDIQKNELGISQVAFDLRGKQVFIKGYIHPGVQGTGKVGHFILVPDMGTCCFGGQPKATDMVEVKIVGNAPKIAYSTQRIKLAGTFDLVNPDNSKSLGLKNIVYKMDVSIVK